MSDKISGMTTLSSMPTATGTAEDNVVIPVVTLGATNTNNKISLTLLRGWINSYIIDPLRNTASGLASLGADSKLAVDQLPTHTHSTAQVVGFDTALSGKADVSALNNYATTTALTSGLSSKANTSHSHAIADVTNLQNSLDAKLPKGNFGAIYEDRSSDSLIELGNSTAMTIFVAKTAVTSTTLVMPTLPIVGQILQLQFAIGGANATITFPDSCLLQQAPTPKEAVCTANKTYVFTLLWNGNNWLTNWQMYG